MVAFCLLSAVLLCPDFSPTSAAHRQSPGPAHVIVLPEGLQLRLRMSTLLDLDTAKVGDSLEAVVVKDARADGKVIVPKKALIRGSIRLLDRREKYTVVGLEWKELEFGNSRAAVRARLMEMISQLPGTERLEIPSEGSPIRHDYDSGEIIGAVVGATNPVLDNNTPGMGTFFVRDAHFKGRNLEMLWRTLPPK